MKLPPLIITQENKKITLASPNTWKCCTQKTVKHNERRLYELENLNYSNLSEPQNLPDHSLFRLKIIAVTVIIISQLKIVPLGNVSQGNEGKRWAKLVC